MSNNVLTVQQVAVALKKDCQTIRFLLDNKLVSYGMSYRRRKSYIIYADKFAEETGIKIAGSEVSNDEV